MPAKSATRLKPALIAADIPRVSSVRDRRSAVLAVCIGGRSVLPGWHCWSTASPGAATTRSRGQVNGDNAGPALNALAHGHLAAMVRSQPLMGLTSILLRAPMVALADALARQSTTRLCAWESRMPPSGSGARRLARPARGLSRATGHRRDWLRGDRGRAGHTSGGSRRASRGGARDRARRRRRHLRHGGTTRVGGGAPRPRDRHQAVGVPGHALRAARAARFPCGGDHQGIPGRRSR